MDYTKELRCLSLFSGIAGFDLGLRLAVPTAVTVGYVERESYCAAVVVKEVEKGRLDNAPIWPDISTFNGQEWAGAVDIITAGFPCPPTSSAASWRRKGQKDARWLWPETKRVIREVQPEWVFIENPIGILSHDRGRTARGLFGDMAQLGFDAVWGVFRASGLGAPQSRARLFVLAHSSSELSQRGTYAPLTKEGNRVSSDDTRPGSPVGVWVPGTTDWEGWDAWLEENASSEPGIPIPPDGIPDRLDAKRAFGNAVVPVVAADAWITLMERFNGES